MATAPRILSIGGALPEREYSQSEMLELSTLGLLGVDWRENPSTGETRKMLERLFSATRVERRRAGLDLFDFFKEFPTTGARMRKYCDVAYPLARAALEDSLSQARAPRSPADLSDFVVVSCTGYTAPGLDILLARDLEMPLDVRRVCVGHMGCHGALAGMRQARSALLAYPGATAAVLCVELTTLHFSPTLDPEVLTSFALFGDGAQSILLSNAADAEGPELVDMYCAADFSGAEQMEWRITDQGFMMGLSPRVPVTLRRNVTSVIDHLLTPHGLTVADISHWVVHPGGPSILEVVQKKLELSDDQMRYSWDVLTERGNCSSATVLIILDRLMRSGTVARGEWGVMMAFGPGLTLETSLIRF